MFTGRVQAGGPRYCPSIEDKIVRFADRERHQMFLEPEGYSTDIVYVNGFSTSLPGEIQLKGLRSVAGLDGGARDGEGNLAVVTHGLVCHGIAARHLSLPADTETPRRWDNTSVTTIDGAPPWRVELLNCCAHLAGDTAPAAG